MVKRVFLIHGWEGYPEGNWRPWLKKELESPFILEHGMKHFSGDDGITEAPIILEKLLEIAK